MTTSLRQAVARLVPDADLEEFVRSRRDAGMAWRKVSNELRDETGVDVTHETLRSWFPDEVTA